MHDTEIRGGTISHGRRQAAFIGDVALNDSGIARAGGKPGPARQAINPNGLSDSFGFHGSERLAAGKRASVIACKARRLRIPKIRRVSPMGRCRLMQRADGYRNTFMSEVPTFKHSVHKGAQPGRLAHAPAL